MNIGISGPIGAGKTTAAKYLASSYSLSYLRYSEVLAEISGQTNADKQELRKLGWHIMSEGLQAALNQRMVSKMVPGMDYVIDGLRHPLDFDILNSHSPFYLLYVDASQDVRWQRLSSRDRSPTMEDFRARENDPTEIYLPVLREKAYKVIQNEGTVLEFYAVLDRVFKDIQTLVKQ